MLAIIVDPFEMVGLVAAGPFWSAPCKLTMREHFVARRMAAPVGS